MTNPPLHHGETMTLPVQPFGRTARSVAGYGVATALLLISPGLMVFAPASIFHCAMRNGRRTAWAAGVLGLVLAALCVYLAPLSTLAEPGKANMAYASFLGIALSIAVPSIVVVPLVERHEKFGIVLTYALIFSAIGLALTEFIMRSAAGFSPYAAQVREQSLIIAQNLPNYHAAFSDGAFARLYVWLLQHMPEVFPASLLLEIAIFFILSLMMVGRLSAWRSFAATRVADSETRRAYLFRNFSWPEWLLFVFVAAGVTPLLTGFPQRIAANTLVLMISLYILQGLAIFRFVLAKAGAGYVGGALGFLLLGMLCTALIGFLFLALAGLFDPFFDFRHLKRKDDSHESHTD